MSLKSPPNSRPIASLVRQRIERGGERLWRLEDFRDLPFAAVAQALSRLTRARDTRTSEQGRLLPHPGDCLWQEPAKPRRNPEARRQRAKPSFHPALPPPISWDSPRRPQARSEVATSALSLPRKLVGSDTVIHTRRPEAWANLSETDAALLDFLRQRGKSSELSPEETIRRTLTLLSEKGRFERLLKVADSEPPRVRAMLGAMGEQLGKNPPALQRLRESLNPFSRFDFRLLARAARTLANWQAKERR